MQMRGVQPLAAQDLADGAVICKGGVALSEDAGLVVGGERAAATGPVVCRVGFGCGLVG